MSDDECYDNEDCEYDYEEYDPDNEEGQEPMDSQEPEDFDDSTHNENDTTSNKNSPTKKSGGNEGIMDFGDVVNLLQKRVSELSSLLEADKNVTQFMLQHFEWDKEKLMESFFNDPEKLKILTGVDLYDAAHIGSHMSKGTSLKRAKSTSPRVPCRVCYDEFQDTYNDMFSLGCGHLFCKDCFGSYLKGQIADGPMCVIAHCPEFKCKQGILPNVFHHFLSTADRETYERFVVRRFIECSKSMHYCPAPNCEKVAICQNGKANIKCGCGHHYCSACKEETHEPASCAQVAKWVEKNASDGESSRWIFVNTKKCPKCYTRIEKNQGCMHMVCSQCSHNWCWVCMGTHHVYVCNEFKPTVDQTVELNAQQLAKVELERYHHYYNRYHNHDQALKFASKQREDAVVKMREMQEKNTEAWIDVQYVMDAVETVVACRRVLKYTYVIGYYLPEKSQEKLLFDRHQEMLEENTERLHECTEGKNVFTADRTQVVNWTRITEQFRRALLDSYVDGVNTDSVGDPESVEDIGRWLRPSPI